MAGDEIPLPGIVAMAAASIGRSASGLSMGRLASGLAMGRSASGLAILALDQGSSHSRAVLFDPSGRVLARGEAPLRTYHPKPGWVEHDAEEIFESAMAALRRALRGGREKGKTPVVLGIANQRSTLVLWDRRDGRPVAPAISWQDRRTAESLESFDSPDFLAEILEKTGLPLTPHYSATKLAWLLQHLKQERVSRRPLLCGTVNSYLIWRLTGGRVHRTDPTNAARTLLYHLDRGDWDPDLLRRFGVPREMLPAVAPTQSLFGEAAIDRLRLPIAASCGDQQASLAGLGALERGEANINYGTGAFFLLNTGGRRHRIPGLLASVARSDARATTYLIEGTVNSAGSLFDWLRELGVLRSNREIDRLCARARERIFLTPALAGLGAPHWDAKAATALFGLTQRSRREEIVRGAVEGIAFLIDDIYRTIQESGAVRIKKMLASGGGSRIKSLIQFQADLAGRAIGAAADPESTARGTAFLAGEAFGLTDRTRFSFSAVRAETAPRIGAAERSSLRGRWRKALELARQWTD